MRRNDRLINEEEAYQILEKGEYGILSMVTRESAPYSIPLNYCVLDGTLYFHCAMDGEKIIHLENNPRVSFCVVGHTIPMPSKFATLYESCIIRGNSSEAFGEEKQKGLEGLIRKYSPDFLEEGLSYIDKLRKKTRVFAITIDSISGKARRS
ncbi:MAG: pyridoxamine 5'-phosphate oxidase family protein [Thermodesulfobacteriota bacterium]